MMNCMGKICTVLVLALLALPVGAMAAAPISTIAQGNTVFLGEGGLDITPPWARIPRSAGGHQQQILGPHLPVKHWKWLQERLHLPYPRQISPADLGNWYRLKSDGRTPDGVAFNVADPNLDIRVYDATVGVDATANGWITTGDEVSFQITTNLYQIAQRAGVTAVPIRIYVQAPDGATYSSLINKDGTTTSIMDVPVTSTPYSTGPIWDTGRHDTYPYGTYQYLGGMQCQFHEG